MPSTDETRVWDEDDVQSLLDTYFTQDRAILKRDSKNYKGLLYQKALTLKPEHLGLLFGAESSLELDDDQYKWLLGPDWQNVQQDYLKKMSAADKVLGYNFKIDLGNVAPEFSLQGFNILAADANVKVRRIVGDGTQLIPPAVNVAIALSIQLCRASRGLLLWQAKARVGTLHEEHWHKVPDLIYMDFRWLPEEKERFLATTFENQRDFLCADLRVQRTDVVLPFLLDFPGYRQDNVEDARITAYVDGVNPPLAAISIPSAAYVGWIKDMTPSQDGVDFVGHYRHKTRTMDSQFLLSKEQRAVTRVRDTSEMCKRIVKMFDNHIPDALVFYRSVIQLKKNALALTNIDTEAADSSV